MWACSSAGLFICQNFDRQNRFSTNLPKFFLSAKLLAVRYIYHAWPYTLIKLLSVHHLCGQKSMLHIQLASLFICGTLSTAYVEAIVTSASLLI